MSLSDLPPPARNPSEGPRIVTLGGGHGQAALLSALAGLECELSAVVSIADDGGCSGRLREELHMPPPGDLRRCLASLATESEVAARFEERLHGGDEAGRCVGNLVLAELRQELGSLQLAVDWAAALLGCVGRVVPAAESAGVLTVWDREHGPLAGESLIERSSAAPLVVVVEGPEAASEYAREAIERADVLLLGPGSFVGSTLAVLATGDVAACVARSRARRILMKNVAKEPAPQGIAGFELVDHERMLSDHLLIASGGEPIGFDVLAHDVTGFASTPRASGGTSLTAPMTDATGRHHDVLLLREALAHHLELSPRPPLTKERRHFEPRTLLEQRLESARRRLFGAGAGG